MKVIPCDNMNLLKISYHGSTNSYERNESGYTKAGLKSMRKDYRMLVDYSRCRGPYQDVCSKSAKVFECIILRLFKTALWIFFTEIYCVKNKIKKSRLDVYSYFL